MTTFMVESIDPQLAAAVHAEVPIEQIRTVFDTGLGEVMRVTGAQGVAITGPPRPCRRPTGSSWSGPRRRVARSPVTCGSPTSRTRVRSRSRQPGRPGSSVHLPERIR